MLPECSLVGRMAIQGLSKSWGYLKAPQPELPMSLALEPPLAAHLPEIVATMTRATERLQVIAGTVGRNMVQMSHRQQKPPGKFLVLRYHQASLQVASRTDSLHKLLRRFPRAEAGSATELTTPVHLGLNVTSDRPPVGRI